MRALARLRRRCATPCRASRGFAIDILRERAPLTKLAVSTDAESLQNADFLNGLVNAGLSMMSVDLSTTSEEQARTCLERLAELGERDVHWMDRRAAEWHRARHSLKATLLEAAPGGEGARVAVDLAVEQGFDFVATGLDDLETLKTAIADAAAAVSVPDDKSNDAAAASLGPTRGLPPQALIRVDASATEADISAAIDSVDGVILSSGAPERAASLAAAASKAVLREVKVEGMDLSVQQIQEIKASIETQTCDCLLIRGPGDSNPPRWLDEASQAAQFADSESPMLWPQPPSANVWMSPVERDTREPLSEIEVMARATVAVAGESAASMILVLTRSGEIARHISKHRPGVPLMLITDSGPVCRRMSVRRGVYPLAVNPKLVQTISEHERPAEALQIAKEMSWIEGGDKVVIVSSAEEIGPEIAEDSMSMRVAKISDFDGPLFI